VTTSAAPDEPSARTAHPLGRLGRTYQLDGALRCHAAGATEAALLTSAQRLLVEGHGVLAVRMARVHGAGLVIAFQGIRSPERAQALVNAWLYLDPDDARAQAALAEAVPLRVGLPVTLDGAPFGTLEAILEGSQPLLQVRAADGRSHLLPANAPYVAVRPGSLAIVAPPPGLLDDD